MANVYTIENEILSIAVNSHGAELSSVKNRVNNFEFIWQADPTVWNRHAPILFPIVGKLNQDTISINGSYYNMKQHGFARDLEFELVQKSNNELKFRLVSNSETFSLFPFHFELFVSYRFVLNTNTIDITYEVNNLSDLTMPFSIGAHPGFQLPMPNLEEYEINFFTMDSFEKQLLLNGLFSGMQEKVNLTDHKLHLNRDTFSKDAIVIKNIATKRIALKHKKSAYQVEMCYDDYTDFGIWSKTNCQDFVCLEPWLGYADNIDSNTSIENKKGIILLKPQGTFASSYQISFSI